MVIHNIFLHVKCTIKSNSVYSDKKNKKKKFLIKENLTWDRLRGETDKKQAWCNSIWHMETERPFLEGSVRKQQC